MRKILFISSLLTFLFTSSIWAADISGTWVLKYTGNQGDERAYDLVIKADGEKLTVTATHPSLGEMAGTGTLKEKDIAMTLTATGERKIGFELKGTVTGNKMAGTREVKIPDDAKAGAQGGDQSGAQRGTRSGASDDNKGDMQRPARSDASGADKSGSQRPARSESSGDDKSGSQRPARGDSSGGSQAGAQGGASAKAPGSDSSKPQETSNAWTAEKKK